MHALSDREERSGKPLMEGAAVKAGGTADKGVVIIRPGMQESVFRGVFFLEEILWR